MTGADATITALLARRARSRGAHPLLVTPDRTMTYQETWDAMRKTAAHLAGAGVAAGDRVVVRLPNGWPHLVAVLAAITAGAVAVPLDPRLRPEPFQRITASCRPRMVFLAADTLATLTSRHEAVTLKAPADPGAVVTISYTSGSTGEAKGVMHTHRSWLASARFTVDRLGLGESSRMLIPLPLHHAYAFRHVLACAVAGGTALVTAGLLDALERIERDRPDGLLLVPESARLLLESFAPIAARCREFVRMISIGTSAMPADLLRGLREAFPRATFHLPYGLTEARVGFLRLDDDPARRRLEAICPGLEVEVVDEAGRPVGAGEAGEIRLRGEGLMTGYYDDDAEAQVRLVVEGFRTGDAGVRCDDGTVALVGRVDDMIKVGGRKVNPLEVEMVLDAHPAVRESAVRAVAGETPALEAIIVPRTAARPEEADLVAHCKRHLDAYKVPRSFVYAAALPRNPMGKLLRG